MSKSATRRYLVEVKDIKTNTNVVLTAADWTEDEKQAAVAQIFRLTRHRGRDLLKMPTDFKKRGKG